MQWRRGGLQFAPSGAVCGKSYVGTVQHPWRCRNRSFNAAWKSATTSCSKLCAVFGLQRHKIRSRKLRLTRIPPWICVVPCVEFCANEFRYLYRQVRRLCAPLLKLIMAGHLFCIESAVSTWFSTESEHNSFSPAMSSAQFSQLYIFYSFSKKTIVV